MLFTPPYAPAAAAGLAGYDTVYPLKSTATQQVYGSGVWSVPVVAGELIVATMHALGNSNVVTPANFTLSLGGVAMTQKFPSAVTSSGVFPGSANFWLVAPTTGTLEVLADAGVSARACAVTLRRITGFDPAAPVALGGAPSVLGSSVTTMAGAAISVGRDGNVVIGGACTRGLGVTAAGSTAFDVVNFDATGAAASNDLTFSFAHKLMVTAASFTPQWSFDVAGQMSGAYLEINKAP